MSSFLKSDGSVHKDANIDGATDSGQQSTTTAIDASHISTPEVLLGSKTNGDEKDEGSSKEPVATKLMMDRSGSMLNMGGLPAEALSKLMRELKEEGGDGDTIELCTFDDTIDTLYNGLVNDFDLSDNDIKQGIEPRGSTALNDSIASIVTKGIKHQEEHPDTCVSIMIYTDGMENSSVFYGGSDGLAKVHQLVSEARKKGIHVIFLATGQDAIQTGETYGIAPGACLSAGHGNFEGLRCASNQVRQVSSGAASKVEFTNHQREQSAGTRHVSAPAMVGGDGSRQFNAPMSLRRSSSVMLSHQ